MTKRKQIDPNKLKNQIDSGKSSHDAALSLGVSKSTVLKKAKEFGLSFSNKSWWRSLWR